MAQARPALQIERLSDRLELRGDGIWTVPHQSAVSFPEDGNALCAQVEDGSFWFAHRNQCIAAVVARTLPPDRRVLVDVGGGNGVVAAHLQQQGVEVLLVEPGESGAQAARDRGLQQVICATFDDAAFAPASLPAIGLFDVVEHVEDDVAFLRSAAAALEPGGHVLLTVPAYSGLWSAEDVHSGHYRRYTQRSLSRALESAGFDVAYGTYLFWFLPMPIALLRALPHRLGVERARAVELDEFADSHQPQRPWVRSLIERLLQPELKRIRSGRSVSFGGSCLMVGRKRAVG